MRKQVSLLSVLLVMSNSYLYTCNAQSSSGKDYLTVSKDKPLGALGVDYEYRLLRGYTIIRTNYNEVTINHPHDRLNPVVAGNIQKFAVRDPYIVGLTTVLTGNPDPNANNDAGYFVLDASTNKITKGLTEQKWRVELKRIGWLHPTLAKPL
jgi:hypothetical protein